METSTKGYHREPGSAPRKPAHRGWRFSGGGIGPVAEASQPRTAGYRPLPGSRPGVSGKLHAQRCGVTSAPRARRTGAKGALGSRPAASEDVQRAVVGLGIVGVGLGTPKGRMSAARRSSGPGLGMRGHAGRVSTLPAGRWGPKPCLPNSSPPPIHWGRKPSLHAPTSCASPCDVTLSDAITIQ